MIAGQTAAAAETASAEWDRGHQVPYQQQHRAAAVRPCLATVTLDDLHLTCMSPTDTQQTRVCSADYQRRPQADYDCGTHQPASRSNGQQQPSRQSVQCIFKHAHGIITQSRAVARKPRDAAAVLLCLKFADDIHHKFKSSQASKARLQRSKHTRAKQNLTKNGHSKSRVLDSVEGDKALSNTTGI